ncbi:MULTISPECIES: S66 peptidase family protein [Pseudanabaena]|uniref:Peptidase U61 LD-carboxypeptidase A n=2 Tax=Pseudanabaena TaxID=1152 RepID=L8MXD4_9CYAN|nr:MULTISPECIES: LD-carboxypeptidase [Pseudanabaena]ELS32652.1 peptidase U61 LD-carboxypeptidase A [Pseudanabaena biceps PCC 7429]MDG3495111.1 LD-carboxypeptidase [Pseudanabaena catenata USMAC16]
MQPVEFPPIISRSQKICAIAPSGALREWERFEQGVKVWRDRGYELTIPDRLSQSWGYLAGTDEHRCQQFVEAWNDPECVAIACARGGYGSMRLLEKLTWQELSDRPKWLIGFSDITALLWAIAKHKGMGGLHAPVLTTLGNEPARSQQQLFDLLEGKIDAITLTGEGLITGKVTGILLPGNLTLATNIINTNNCPDLENVILAIEDVAEAPYRVDRMLTHWRWTGHLRKLKGIAIGRFSQAEVSTPSLTMEEVWRDRLSDLGIPIVMNLPFGHDGENAPLPVGCIAELDGDNGTLSYRVNN